jgi:hypothetical protein
VMVDTMRELCQQAENAPTPAERIEKKLAACAVAKDAAPYIHPRLAAVAASVRRVNTVKDLSDAELAALIQSLGGEVIDGQAEPLPLPAGKHDLN